MTGMGHGPPMGRTIVCPPEPLDEAYRIEYARHEDAALDITDRILRFPFYISHSVAPSWMRWC